MESLNFLEAVQPLLKLHDARHDLWCLAPVIIDCFENDMDSESKAGIRKVQDALKAYENILVKRQTRLYVMTNYFIPVFATYSLQPNELKHIVSQAEKAEGGSGGEGLHFAKREECILLCGFNVKDCYIHTIPLSFLCALLAECASMNLVRSVAPYRLLNREDSDAIRLLPFGNR